ncbi:MAG TPA: signal peptide peptidase SppA [Stellaceae bacterium]|nr:signal peptide peptidase SppA [Stellaceae bacterium]
MRRFFIGLFVVIGVVAIVGLLAIVGVAVVAVRYAEKAKHLPDAIVLTADLTGGLADGPDSEPLSRLLFNEKTTLRDFVDALDRAGGDSRVESLYIELGDDSMGLAKTQQVRDAIAAFRAKGKFAVAYADTFGEGGPGTRPYYLATACEEIWLQPLGEVGLTGLRSETPFLRGALDKLGILPDFEHREEFKTATNSLTETQMTAPQREEMEGILSSVSDQVDRGIAAARRLTPEKVAALVDRGPLMQDEARDAGLIDQMGYRDQAMRRAQAKAGGGAKFVSLSRYLKAAGRPHASGSEIALVYGTGLITRGGAGGLSSATDFTARAMAKALDAAARDKNVRAILLRIDSPGGSATASETIWREVQRARERGKPVIVSMGDVAASGGYYIAAAADKIVAEPATLTGSIGVLAGKLVVADLMKKIGVTVDSAQRGANAGMFGATEDFSPQARERLNASLDQIYAGFKAHVAAGRHLDPGAVEAAAKGRVWTGAEAKDKGLVDALGGYEVALRLAREAAHLAADAPVDLVVFPKERGLVATLLGRLLGRDEDDDRYSTGLERGLGAVRTLAGAAQAVLDDSGVLRMPPIGEIR